MKIAFVFSAVALILCFCSEIQASVSIEDADCEPRRIWTDEGCIRKECLSSGKQIESASCGVIMCGEGLELKDGDKSKPYPDCCPICKPSN